MKKLKILKSKFMMILWFDATIFITLIKSLYFLIISLIILLIIPFLKVQYFFIKILSMYENIYGIDASKKVIENIVGKQIDDFDIKKM